MVEMSWKAIRPYLPRVRFLTLHYVYFISMSLLASLIFWGSSTPARSVSYIDSLFVTTSAMTVTGLTSLNLSTLNTFQQIMLYILNMCGSAITVSIAVVLVRKQAFEKRFSDIVAEQRRRRRQLRRRTKIRRATPLQEDPSGEIIVGSMNTAIDHPHVENKTASWQNPVNLLRGRLRLRFGRKDMDSTDEKTNQLNISETAVGGEPLSTRQQEKQNNPNVQSPTHVTFSDDVRRSSREQPQGPSHQSLAPVYSNTTDPLSSLHNVEDGSTLEDEDDDLHLRFLGSLGRNSTFYNLDDDARDKLGGVEYRAIQMLLYIVPLYFIIWQFIGGLAVGAYLSRNRTSVVRTYSKNPWWAGFFLATGAFTNSGMSLIDAGMAPFQTSKFLLLTLSLLMLAGNTCYPIFLRWSLRAIQWMLPDTDYGRYYRETVQFLLDHPRRCYTTLFQSKETWWLFASVVGMNALDWILFEILNYDNPVVDSIPLGSRILDGLFQSLAVRTTGFSIVSISSLQIGLQLVYVVMMYISVYPVVITMRNSNVYEERSLGIYDEDTAAVQEEEAPATGTPNSSTSQLPTFRASGRMYFIQQQLRAQLAYDMWWMVLAAIVICIIEAGNFKRDPITFSAFNIIFETVSGYGCVGLSTGLPDQSYSFSGAWHTLSKLIMCAVMLRGRHRDLPVAIDRAILLPGEHLSRAEEEDAKIRMQNTMGRPMSRRSAS
ncbi:hypothetical protein Plec18170_009581 [Paecilomyces lecythidis]